jgi:Mce-associated membrane protein
MEVDADRPLGAALSPDPGGTTTRNNRSSIVFLLLAALLVLLVVASVLLGLKWKDDRAQQARYDAVLAAARHEALAFTTLDYRTLDKDISNVVDNSTGKFRKQYEAGTANIKQTVTTNKSVSKGKVLAVGLVSCDANTARVIVVADSTVTNVRTTTPQPRHYRIQFDLVRQGGHWLTSDLQFVV